MPELPADAAAIVTSKLHSVVLTSSGSLSSAGFGEGGRLGHGSNESHSFFKHVAALDRVRVMFVAVSDNHTLAVTHSGGVYGWGNNEFGQLGLGVPGSTSTSTRAELAPRRLSSLDKVRITQAACGISHSVLLQSDGSVWTTGCNTEAQLGFSLLDPYCPVPRRVEALVGKHVCAIAAAASYTALATRPQSGAPAVFMMGMGKALVRVTLPFTATYWSLLLAQGARSEERIRVQVQVQAQVDRTWLLVLGQLFVVEHTAATAASSEHAQSALGRRALMPRCTRGKTMACISAPQDKGATLAVTHAGLVYQLHHTSRTETEQRGERERRGASTSMPATMSATTARSPAHIQPARSPGGSWSDGMSQNSPQARSNEASPPLPLPRQRRQPSAEGDFDDNFQVSLPSLARVHPASPQIFSNCRRRRAWSGMEWAQNVPFPLVGE